MKKILFTLLFSCICLVSFAPSKHCQNNTKLLLFQSFFFFVLVLSHLVIASYIIVVVNDGIATCLPEWLWLGCNIVLTDGNEKWGQGWLAITAAHWSAWARDAYGWRSGYAAMQHTSAALATCMMEVVVVVVAQDQCKCCQRRNVIAKVSVNIIVNFGPFRWPYLVTRINLCLCLSYQESYGLLQN